MECRTSTGPTTTNLRSRRRTDSTPAAATNVLGVDRRDSASPHPNRSSPHDISQETERAATTWVTSNPSDASGSQASPRPPNPRHESSNLPGFDGDSALAITRKIFKFQRAPAFKDRATFAIPGGGCRDTNGTNSSNNVPAPLIAVSEIIGIQLPSYDVCNRLLETYFSTVHWFSLVVYEPKFRPRYSGIVGSGLASRNDRGFLLLLVMVLIMGCWYSPKQGIADLESSELDIDSLRNELLTVVQRDFMELMDEDSLEFVQLCTLLGSFYLYHGKPRSSFSILGAATKTAQAMDLHRDSEARWSFEDTEERKRVWWTIYTWDRFATVTYGRPLGINDKDCNVSMPADVLENIHFDPQLNPTQICLSAYQYKLNLVYRIASPLFENIYGIRTSQNLELFSQLPAMVATANQALLEWQHDLPPHLCYDQLNDLTSQSSPQEKAHSLQALSLQLTYDNIMIVLHRPLLAGRGPIGQSIPPEISTPNSDDMREVSFKRCLNSALRISNLQRKKNLFLLARTTHLVSFLGMNIFTASVVLFICALSDTLSDTSQEAKRGLKRTLQMQKALSNHASLSMQCSVILEDLVQLILTKEMEEMLDDQTGGDENMYDPSISSEQQAQNSVNQVQGSHDGSNANPGLASGVFDPLDDSFANPDGSHFSQSLRTLQRGMQSIYLSPRIL
ncbi:C6 transcription factor [Phlyctema vagabunda]|uniref:C6 transcription factor n=1 Tax=Phlyctema vagabunda TaxID=108571 RepID=A0ABR4P491_9HELO